ncbi:MAG: hypothetical protein QM742_01810 [Aquabacterium sp.]
MTETLASHTPGARHWVLPFASSLSEPCRHALAELGKPHALPHLRRLLGAMEVTSRLEGDEFALSMPHERVLGAQLGWPDEDGCRPWAAWWAAQDGIRLEADRTWGLLSPGHWLMGRDHLTLLDPDTQGLSADASRALMEALRELFESDGWTLIWGAPTRWYAAHASLAGLPTASLDRVIGRNPDVWLTDHPQARMLRRLQSEVQMLLYQHPINDARESQGQTTVNSFWLSGCGPVPAQLTLPTTTHWVQDLRAPLLADDMPLWLQAWAQVDATALQAACEALDQGQDIRLTLCGERHALTLAPRKSGFGARLRQSLRRLTGGSTDADPVRFLEAL